MEDKKIVVTGGTGLLGMALKQIMPEAFYVSSKQYNLTIEDKSHNLFYDLAPTHIIHLAATVSGIQDNIIRPFSHFTDNVLMNTHLIEYSEKRGVRRFIGMLSTCAYQDNSPVYPLTEEMIFDGKPAATNFSYGFAKRGMAVQIEACNKQYGTEYQYMIPCNLYGDHDKYDDGRSHYVAALIKKIHTAKANGHKSITLFGTGKPLRQFIYAGDVAKIIKHFIENDITENINIASDETYTIHEIAQIALMACDAEYLKIEYDSLKPDGQFRKDCSNKKLKDLMPGFEFTSLFEGIKKTYEFYKLKQA